ncbi:hypothetical protein JXA02_11070 [candidate division KSB1 bacterium]|nr:hypothetical protein [candidate division KSB1 bacterium]RQW02792.1 MAG: hypothetical protein EH222_13185 [candidate division KSB1 bacterium]
MVQRSAARGDRTRQSADRYTRKSQEICDCGGVLKEVDQIGDRADSQRIDKWLHIACLFKTRSKAAKACEERRIKVNGVVARPATHVQGGDELTVRRPNGHFVNMKILAISQRNVSSKEAKFLYEVEDLPLSEEAKELMELFSESFKYEKPKYKGRPTKKERRKMEKSRLIVK